MTKSASQNKIVFGSSPYDLIVAVLYSYWFSQGEQAMTPQQFIHNLQALIRQNIEDKFSRESNREILQTLESLRVSLNSNPLRYFHEHRSLWLAFANNEFFCLHTELIHSKTKYQEFVVKTFDRRSIVTWKVAHFALVTGGSIKCKFSWGHRLLSLELLFRQTLCKWTCSYHPTWEYVKESIFRSH